MRTSERTNEIGPALVALGKLVENPPKKSSAKIDTKQGGSFSYTYLELPDLLDAVRPHLHACGLAVLQGGEAVPGGIGVTTMVIHLSGQWIETGPLPVPAGPDPKAVGSANTYGRRYSLAAILGIAADEDDDGASAGRARPQEGQSQQRKSKGDGKADAGGGAKTTTTPRGKGESESDATASPKPGEVEPHSRPLPVTDEQKSALREMGARKALEGARELFQTDDRKIPNIGVLTADEAWQLIQHLREGAVA